MNWTTHYQAAERARQWVELTPAAVTVFVFFATLIALSFLKRDRSRG